MESNGHIISKLKTTHTTQRIFFFENIIRESLYVYVWTHTYGEKVLKKLTMMYI